MTGDPMLFPALKDDQKGYQQFSNSYQGRIQENESHCEKKLSPNMVGRRENFFRKLKLSNALETYSRAISTSLLYLLIRVLIS